MTNSTLKMLNGGTIGSVSAKITAFSITNSTLSLPVSASSAAATVNTLNVGGSTNTINIASVQSVTGYPVQFQLISYMTENGDLTTFVLGTLSNTYQGYISNNVGNLSMDLVITNGPAPAKADEWGGGVNNLWNTTTLNWTNNGSAVQYNDGDFVTFDDLGRTNKVNLTGTRQPATLTFNNNVLNYTLTGTGSISGPVQLVMNGTASLTLAETGGDNFSQGITVNGGGTVILDDANNAISGGLLIGWNNGTPATVQIGNNDTNGVLPSGSLIDEGTLIFDRTDNITVNQVISDNGYYGALIQNGSGTLTLSANNAYIGNTTVNAGTLALNGSGSINNSPVVTVGSATLDVSGVTSGSGVTLLQTLNLANSTLKVNAGYLQTDLNLTGSLNMSGTANTINVGSLPPIAHYPATNTLLYAAENINGYNFVLGSLPSASPAYAGTIAQSGDGNSVLLTLTAGPIGVRPFVTWSGVDALNNVNTNWSDIQNWQLPGAPTAVDNVVFNNTASVGASALSTPGGGIGVLIPGNFNNIVDTNFTVSTLTFTNLGGTYHNTEIVSGKMLNITNTLTIGGISTGASAQQGFVTMSGSGAALSVINPSANVQIWDGAVSGSQATLDLSALDNFTNIVSRLAIGASVNNTVDRPSGVLWLAKTNTITAEFQTTTTDSGSTTADAGIVVADTSSNPGSESFLWLGEVNTITADTIAIGRQKAGGNLQFNPIYANVAPYPSVKFQGFSADALSLFEVAGGAANSGTTTFTADANLTGGFVTATINTLTVGRGSAAVATTGTGNTTGSLEFDAGTITANTVNIGIQSANTTKYGVGTISVNTNSTIGNNATLSVSGTLNLGISVGGVGAATTSGTLDINGGTVLANTIVVGTNNATSTITLNGGTLIVTNTGGTPAAPLTTLNLNGGTLQLNVNGNSIVTNIVAITVNNSVATTIQIGSLANITGTVTFPLMSYTGTDPSTNNLSLATLPMGYTGSLVDDTANSSIDLSLTSSVKPTPHITDVSVSGITLTINATNGAVGGQYVLLGTTNVAKPLSQWTPMLTNNFDGSGNLNLSTNIINRAVRQQFYILKQ
jgi:autotransporter-associated beta strand protein